MESKPFYKSKMFWFNLGAAVIFAAIGALEEAGAATVVPFWGTGVAVVNIILRAFTNQPVTLK